MKLKIYQEKVLKELVTYLGELSAFKAKYQKALEFDAELAAGFDFPKKAFTKSTGKPVYQSKSNGLDEPMPDIYLKVPTGGGKTLLACHSIDLIQKNYLNKQYGLVLWIVPTTQIYRQTILALKDRAHPYREILDISSGGKTLIKEKTELFTPTDVAENLVVLMLMLPSANRQNKETLKVFRDAGGFTDFFPNEDAYEQQVHLLKKILNLDFFGSETEVFNRQIKTSLGNTLKLLQPIVIIDEGHRAYGDNARQTIQNFNPSFVLELSATPPPLCNELVKITGRELHEEEMIKLDIHLTNKTSLDWKDTLLASFEKQNHLENLAKGYEQNTGKYIRPICLIQVERTGEDQRGKGFIHAEDAKEYLLKKCSVPENQIAIKSSDKDDIEGVDLFSKNCDIRYIITKQALQEGWDCSFAYVLTILTNPSSATGITQLVGRILRQPNAIKTKIAALDECYIFAFRPSAKTLLDDIKKGLEDEGLGDISGRLILDEGAKRTTRTRDFELNYRPKFKKFEGKIYLPKFVIQEKESWRDLVFESDILSQIDWTKVDISEIAEKTLSQSVNKEQELTIGLSQSGKEILSETSRYETRGTLAIDEVFFAQQISDIIPNPWMSFSMAAKTIALLTEKYKFEIVASNFVFIIEELKKILNAQKNILAEAIFRNLIEQKKLHFFLLSDKGSFNLPTSVIVQSEKQLVRKDNSPIQKSLFDYVPEENINELEKAVAIYLDEQEKLLWWYRNMSRKDYNIQGWRRHKIYPDFIAADKKPDNVEDYESIFVLETKGLHLKNEDTKYKQDVFKLCNELGAKKPWKELSDEFSDHKFNFQVVFEDEWQNKMNELLT